MKKNFNQPDTCIRVNEMPSIDSNDITIHNVPLIVATPSSFKDYGCIVDNFAEEQVFIETWPAPSWRKVEPGTGNEGGITTGKFVFEKKGGLMLAKNHAVVGNYISGWFSDPATANSHEENVDYRRVFVREANYHPDGGQVFFPSNGDAFVALLALPGDDISPKDFVAFYCDGSFGIQIFANIWHQPIFPLAQQAIFDGKQGKVHACIACDFVSEFGCYLSVPLEFPHEQ